MLFVVCLAPSSFLTDVSFSSFLSDVDALVVLCPELVASVVVENIISTKNDNFNNIYSF